MEKVESLLEIKLFNRLVHHLQRQVMWAIPKLSLRFLNVFSPESYSMEPDTLIIGCLNIFIQQNKTCRFGFETCYMDIHACALSMHGDLPDGSGKSTPLLRWKFRCRYQKLFNVTHLSSNWRFKKD